MIPVVIAAVVAVAALRKLFSEEDQQPSSTRRPQSNPHPPVTALEKNLLRLKRELEGRGVERSPSLARPALGSHLC
jgi:hypothetical protein